jgi:hypothetical protein
VWWAESTRLVISGQFDRGGSRIVSSTQFATPLSVLLLDTQYQVVFFNTTKNITSLLGRAILTLIEMMVNRSYQLF